MPKNIDDTTSTDVQGDAQKLLDLRKIEQDLSDEKFRARA